jgi:hypothetical protein
MWINQNNQNIYIFKLICSKSLIKFVINQSLFINILNQINTAKRHTTTFSMSHTPPQDDSYANGCDFTRKIIASTDIYMEQLTNIIDTLYACIGSYSPLIFSYIIFGNTSHVFKCSRL